MTPDPAPIGRTAAPAPVAGAPAPSAPAPGAAAPSAAVPAASAAAPAPSAAAPAPSAAAEGTGAAAPVPPVGDPFPAAAADGRPRNTVDALVQLSFLVQRVLSGAGAEHDLSVIQIRLLGILRDRQAGMLELGAHLGLDKSSMTGLVGRAEKRGLVLRSPSPHDGRAVLVSLTPLGRRLTERAGAEIGRRVAALAEHLTDAQRAELTALAADVVSPPPARSCG